MGQPQHDHRLTTQVARLTHPTRVLRNVSFSFTLISFRLINAEPDQTPGQTPGLAVPQAVGQALTLSCRTGNGTHYAVAPEIHTKRQLS